MIQLLVASDAEKECNQDELQTLILLPLKKIVLFPGLIVPLSLKQQSSIQLAKKIHKQGGVLGAITQRKLNVENPGSEDLFEVGTLAKILKVVSFPDGSATAVLQGSRRFRAEHIEEKGRHLVARARLLENKPIRTQDKEARALIGSLKEVARSILKLSPEIPSEIQTMLGEIKDPDFLTYFLAANISADTIHKQRLLELNDSTRRATLLLQHLLKDLELTQLKKEIQSKVHTDIDHHQREQYLRHQLKVLQEELGDSDSEELNALRAKGEKKKWSQEVKTFFGKVLGRAERLSPHNPDYSVLINQAEVLVEMPWGVYTKDATDLERAANVLDKAHFGLEKVKARILEYLAVLQLKGNLKGPILCLYGPPGVGKTSLCQSIAKAMTRKYVRVSLGGLNDEAEIRGHRKTYVGAMPGRIISGIKKAQTSNPLFVLDELDKVSSIRGDASAALLEVLDPEQNQAFVDNFLEVPYDLSKVFFIATANRIDTIPPALRDRLEIIEIGGYTLEEKVEVVSKHLLNKQRKLHGLRSGHLKLQREAIADVVEHYTRESGVRELERQVANLARKTAKAVAMQEPYARTVAVSHVRKLLGAPRYDKEIYQKNLLPGVVIGLAWTAAGGEILFIEATLSKGKGKLTLSGQLGDVMKESAVTALSYLRAHSEKLQIDYGVFEKYDLHIHVPAGAVPKDGPSAGITICTALASLYTQRSVKEGMAMTGEITLRGKVLPVGGVQEKLLAAKRVGIDKVILSNHNRKDVEEIHSRYREGLHIHYVEDIDEVLEQALEKSKAKNAKKWHVGSTSEA